MAKFLSKTFTYKKSKKGPSEGFGKKLRERMEAAKKNVKEGDVRIFGNRRWKYSPEGKWVIQKEFMLRHKLPYAKKMPKKSLRPRLKFKVKRKKKNEWIKDIMLRAKDRILKGKNEYRGIPYIKKNYRSLKKNK